MFANAVVHLTHLKSKEAEHGVQNGGRGPRVRADRQVDGGQTLVHNPDQAGRKIQLLSDEHVHRPQRRTVAAVVRRNRPLTGRRRPRRHFRQIGALAVQGLPQVQDGPDFRLPITVQDAPCFDAHADVWT